jgi:uncharacterized membrane protein YidH (DUF202 family)
MPGPRPGTQVERTLLSWSRTALAALALAAVAFKAGIGRGDVADILTGSLATLAAATTYLCGRARATHRPDAAGTGSLAAVRLVAVLVLPAVGAGAAAVLLAIR